MAGATERRVALVTGGAGGLGIAVGARLAQAGHGVALLDRPGASWDAARAAIGDGLALALEADAADRGAVALAVEDVARGPGPPTWLVHAAGIAGSSPVLPPDDDLFDRTMAVNVRGAWVAATACLPHMLAAGSGAVVLVASTAGLRAYRYTAAYVASKHAVVGLTRALAEDLAGRGVTVNAVCPGFMDTPMTDRTVATIVAKTGREAGAVRAFLAGLNASGRLVRPEEVADRILALLEDPGATGLVVPLE
jgi:3-hydroxybutyrate dehydrogenase